MSPYELKIFEELELWQHKMQASPSLLGQLSKDLQTRINRVIPDKVHAAITMAIEKMTRAVILGAGFTTPATNEYLSLEELENQIRKRIIFYRNTAAAEGAITGAGGILMGLADFPLWLTIKMKMLFEIASMYGYDIRDYKERVYILHIFQLTFSSQIHKNKIYSIMAHWKAEQQHLPDDFSQFDWRSFQQEYRDYIDLAKLLQLVPGIGAVVGAYVNHRLTYKLGACAMNAYRLRLQENRMKIKVLPSFSHRAEYTASPINY